MITLDTNVLIYACDRSNPDRQRRAAERGIGSQSFKRFSLSFRRGPGILQHARDLHLSHGVSFWDSMILAACAEAGIETLYSEDVPGLATEGCQPVRLTSNV
jgi:predicted nucleic acid-binding protein